MSDPKGNKPESDDPHEDEFPLEMHPAEEGSIEGSGLFPLESMSMSASIEDFQFSGPAEELDFTEPADFTFPTQQPGEGEVVSESTGDFAAGETAEGEHFFGGEETTYAEPEMVEEGAVEPELAGEGIADLEAAEEESPPKPKFQLPAWVHTLEWVTVGILAVGGLLAIIVSIFWIDNNPKQVTLILNIACPVLVGLIPYALWRSSKRWATLPVTALYTVLLALSTAALIAGTWVQGQELTRYDWQYNKTRVNKGKPAIVFIPAAAEPAPAPAPAVEPPAEPPPAKNSAEPAKTPAAAKSSAEPAK